MIIIQPSIGIYGRTVLLGDRTSEKGTYSSRLKTNQKGLPPISGSCSQFHRYYKSRFTHIYIHITLCKQRLRISKAGSCEVARIYIYIYIYILIYYTHTQFQQLHRFYRSCAMSRCFQFQIQLVLGPVLQKPTSLRHHRNLTQQGVLPRRSTNNLSKVENQTSSSFPSNGPDLLD